MSLTPKQAAVVENPFSNKLVCALPGSGKTHTMISLSQNILNHPGTTILQQKVEQPLFAQSSDANKPNTGSHFVRAQ